MPGFLGMINEKNRYPFLYILLYLIIGKCFSVGPPGIKGDLGLPGAKGDQGAMGNIVETNSIE